MHVPGQRGGAAITADLGGRDGVGLVAGAKAAVANNGGTEKFTARARVVDSRPERDRLFKEMCKIWPSFADYETRTERLIPVVILERER